MELRLKFVIIFILFALAFPVSAYGEEDISNNETVQQEETLQNSEPAEEQITDNSAEEKEPTLVDEVIQILDSSKKNQECTVVDEKYSYNEEVQSNTKATIKTKYDFNMGDSQMSLGIKGVSFSFPVSR